MPLPEGLPEEVISLLVNVLYAVVQPASEDCKDMNVLTSSRFTDENAGLTLNVWVPEGTKPGDGLPVVAVSTTLEGV